MILSELEWIVDKSDEDEDSASLSSAESLSWDFYNERKCKTQMSEVSPIASISSSLIDEEEEEILDDVFQTITPTSPTQTQPSSLSFTPVQTNPSPIKFVTISCSTAPSFSTPRNMTAAPKVRGTAPEIGPYRTPCTSFTDTEDESELEEVNERKCQPEVDNFVSKMSARVAALAPLATYKPVKEVEYPQVDLNHLNSHFIKNIPKPCLYPILGCSDDPEFYARVDHRREIQNFFKEFPRGSEYGYSTNLGIVAVPDQPIFGYIWSGGEFMIQAATPSSRASCTSSGAPTFKSRRGRAGG